MIVLISLFLTIALISTQVYAQEKTNEEYKQNNPSFWLSISSVAAAIGASAAAVGLFFNGLARKADANSRSLQVMRDFANEIEKLEDSGDRNSPEHFDIFAKKYLNLLDRIAFLAINENISPQLVKYFKYSFRAALGILEKEFPTWKTEYEEFLIKWCTQEGLTYDTESIKRPTKKE